MNEIIPFEEEIPFEPESGPVARAAVAEPESISELTTQFGRQLVDSYGGRFEQWADRDIRGRPGVKSKHATGEAIDYYGDAMERVAADATQSGARRVIFNRQIWEPDTGWRAYRGVNPHTDHVHIEPGRAPTRYTAAAGPAIGEIPFEAEIPFEPEPELPASDADWTPEKIAAHNAQAEKLRALPAGSLTQEPGALETIGAVSDATKAAALQGNLYDVFTPRDPAEIVAEQNKTPLQNISEGLQEPTVSIPTPEVTGPGTGFLRGAANLAEGLSSPMNLALIPFLGGAPGIVKGAAGVGFGVPMVKHAISETLPAALDASSSGEAVQNLVEGVGGLAMATGALGAGRPKKGGAGEAVPRVGSEDVVAVARNAAEAATRIPEAPTPKTPLQAKSLESLGVPFEPEPVIRAAEVEAAATGVPTPPAAPPARPEAVKSPETPTGIRNAIVDQERVARGLPARMEPLRRSFGTIWDEAMGVVDKDAAAGTKLAEAIAKEPRPLEDWESALLAHEQVTRQNTFDRAIDEVNAAPDGATKIDAQARLDRARDDVQLVYDVGQRVGTKSGQSLAARKLLVNKDYTLARMEAETRAVVNEGKPLSAQQTTEVKALHAKITETEAKLATLEQREQSRQAQQAFENVLKEQKVEASAATKRGKAITDFLEEQASKARERIIARRGRLNVTVDPLNVAGLVDEAIIGASYIARGVKNVAEWSTKMVSDFGDRIKPYLNDLFERAKQLHDANAELFTEKKGRGAKKSAAERAKAQSEKGVIDPQIVYDLAREKVNAGMGELEAVMKAVHKDLEPLHPGLTEREVRDAFSGYGKTKIPSKEADLVKLRELRRLGQLVSGIEDALRKEPPKKTGLQRDKPSQEVRDKMKELQKVMREQGIETTSPEQQLASANQARATALRNQIEDLDRQLKTGQKPPKGATAPVTAEVERLRAERDAMKTQLDELENPPRTPEQVQLQRDKKAIQRRTEELKRRVAAGDYAPKSKKEPVMDREKADLLFANQKAKEQYMRGLFEAKLKQRSLPRKAWDTVVEALNTSRALMTSLDLSAVLRQGGFVAFGHPVRALKSFPAMLRAFGSEKAQFRVEQEIASRPNAALYAQSKLFLSEQAPISLTRMEEQFASRWAGKIPLVAGSQRAYTTFLNKLRADSFDAMAATLTRAGKPTLEEARAIANFVNVATGRGSLPGQAAQAAQGLNTVFFAPRYVLSRFQLIAGQPLYGGTMRTRALIASEYARYLAGVGTVYALAAATNDNPIELDPTSTDFLKIRFGDTRLDPLSGLIQATVFSARETEALKRFFTQSAEKKPKYGSGGDVLFRFLRSKLSPAVGAAVNAVEGQNIVGEKVTPASTATSLVIPISYGEILETMEEQGIPRGTALSLLSLFGMGVQTYEDKKRK